MAPPKRSNADIETTRRVARGFRNFENYRIRNLLAAGGQRPYRKKSPNHLNTKGRFILILHDGSPPRIEYVRWDNPSLPVHQPSHQAEYPTLGRTVMRSSVRRLGPTSRTRPQLVECLQNSSWVVV